MNFSEAEVRLIEKFGKDEANAILRYLKDANMELKTVINRLMNDEPVQYVVEFAWFYNRKFSVNHHTLIPRPETEELCELIIRNHKNSRPKILEIGTGSGCISVTLAAEIKNCEIIATDIDAIALATAKKNADDLGVSDRIAFVQSDFLSEFPEMTNPDIIVSNPPYISEDEKENMLFNVLNFEPHHALFAPGQDPLIFYKRIATLLGSLENSAECWLELNASLSHEIKDIFSDFNARIVQDISGNNRFLHIKKEG